MLEFINTSGNCYHIRLDKEDYAFEEVVEEIFRVRDKHDSGHFFLNAPTDIEGYII